MRTINETLRCDLTESELNEKGQLMSAKVLEYDELEEKKKEAATKDGERLKTIRGQIRELSDTIRSKTVYRPVEVSVSYHTPEPGLKRLARMDTGDWLRDEPMTLDERQANLFEDVKDLRAMFGEGPAPDSQ